MFFKKSKKVNDELQQELQKLREENEKLKMGIVDWKGSCRDNRNTIEYMFKLKELESERNELTRNELTRELNSAYDCLVMYISSIENVIHEFKEQYRKYGKYPDFEKTFDLLMVMNGKIKDRIASIYKK
jgi:hypothetical protein